MHTEHLDYIPTLSIISSSLFPFLRTNSTAIKKVHVKCYYAILTIEAMSICLTQLQLFSNPSPTTACPFAAHLLILAHPSYLLTPESKKPKYTSTDGRESQTKG